jgi:hypothetical protein
MELRVEGRGLKMKAQAVKSKLLVEAGIPGRFPNTTQLAGKQKVLFKAVADLCDVVNGLEHRIAQLEQAGSLAAAVAGEG